MRLLITKQPKLALGVQVAIAVMAGGKAHGGPLASGTLPVVPQIGTLLPQGVIRKFLAWDYQGLTRNNGRADDQWAKIDSNDSSSDKWTTTSTVAKYEPMSYQEARLWLQAYNAGPYALLKYRGHVPYRETQNYVPRVMKYYGMKLDDTPYDAYIVSSAEKYGLDPQLIRAVMKTESDFKSRTVSNAGARGLMQVMPCVWSDVKKKYGMSWDYSGGVYDPEKNIEVACAYLAWLRYDFLPRHFANFEPLDSVPAAVVRDKGVPVRKTPRISVQAQQVPTAAAYVRAVSQVRNMAASPEERATRSAVELFTNIGLGLLSEQSAASEKKEAAAGPVSLLKLQAVETLQQIEAIMSPQMGKKKRERVISRAYRKSTRRHS